ncbi:calcium-translocating P-type ATPase, SERCA-type [Paenibacillus apiarius]|uniref:Calcium-translocating P-type ATPase, SERCA-type n=1 Tax=Paenibacillus apiarius TaxID=46240 RepID=A0ABT4DPN6_9BACL|nr:calcium-translocating P-type ATPase, SERCA-type [Paenibacillus apiarius]MCY9513687.1 calcium-translocating P-type ATPase, SERCA-type [Paenibacillus apiarius]MCY9518238.1 calcium-translocating P-type ATPase, SERCA-type [Paenibacillus apiarius]MCY9551361.1 calcium-translocating P-type ATPase, SERCA-type [Paenibacillus apiarius]MCY9558515.1 calcium-translocating P-type ATPase, SERCA-type [Paenibacillus apiarius]MCY9684171.1 calcium-translocating P-type ATPase, SERCA-type [Paenibacillus apiariu
MDQTKWHQLTANDLLHALGVHAEQGLSEEDAAARQERYGRNELSEGKRVSPLALFFNQFKDFMVLVLAGATLVSGMLGEYLDAITIIAIILLNGVLGFVQEFRAERSLRALKQLSAPMAKVVRSGKLCHINAHELVPGDVVLMESGDRLPADIRWISTSSCYVEESALTGESVPVNKHHQAIKQDELPLGDLKNIGFMGTMMTRGTGKGVVIRTGMDTEMGKIAHMIENTESMDTPLQHRLEQLGKILIIVALALTVMVVVAGILHGQPAMGMFLAGVSLAVAAIPEGLPAIVTIALALGVQRMIKRKAIVRKLPSVETLGCASVICSDKTGTLTQNKMTVTRLWMGGRALEVSGEGFEPTGQVTEEGKPLDLKNDQALRRFLQISALCNNAVLSESYPSELRSAKGSGKQAKKAKEVKKQGSEELKPVWDIKGDPTEGALLVLAAKLGMTPQTLAGMYARMEEYPFDSERKRMSVIVTHQGGRNVLAKGAPDVLLNRCSYILWDGKVVPLTAGLKQKALAANEAMAKQALRVLGLAYRELKASEPAAQESAVESQLIFVGLAGMIDPPRREARDAIAVCRRAGIKTVMITGDHQLTAEAIAHQLGIIPHGGQTVNGVQLAQMDDDALDKVIDNIYVYARVSPEHKLRIVKSLQRKGHVVAMTGDGVNDAPAIKAADIGIAMGITGTDVSKEASALILSDDNFATIVAAIEEGRGIYENIRKFIRYLLASNVGEILVMFFAMMLGLPLPLVPIQILWVNLVTDGLPAMALGVDQPEKDLMEHRPRAAKENIFARRLGWKIISRGLLIGVCTLIAFWLTWSVDPNSAGQLTKAQSVAFATLVMAQLIHVFDCRSSRSIFHRNMFQNRYLVLSVASSLLLLLAVLYVEPLQPIFKTVPLHFRDWAITFVMAGIPTFLMGIGSVLSGQRSGKSGGAKPAYTSNRRAA